MEKNSRIQTEEGLIRGIAILMEQDSQYERYYAKHNYIYGLSDSFEDVRNFYYDAVLYVIGLENALVNLTQQPT